jgi:hypothetical protein
VEARRVADQVQEDSDQYVTDRLVRLEEELNRILKEVRAGIRSMGKGGGKTAPDGLSGRDTLDSD